MRSADFGGNAQKGPPLTIDRNKKFMSSNEWSNEDMDASEDDLKGLAYTAISFVATVIMLLIGVILLVG